MCSPSCGEVDSGQINTQCCCVSAEIAKLTCVRCREGRRGGGMERRGMTGRGGKWRNWMHCWGEEGEGGTL